MKVRVELFDGYGEGELLDFNDVRKECLVRYRSVLNTDEEVWLPIKQLLVQKMAWAPVELEALMEHFA